MNPINYFNLLYKETVAKVQAQVPSRYVHLQYLSLTLGILVQPLLQDYIATGEWKLPLSKLFGKVVFSLLIGLAIFPAVYKSSWDENSPFFLQFCTVFSAGLGWQTLFSAGAQAIN